MQFVPEFTLEIPLHDEYPLLGDGQLIVAQVVPRIKQTKGHALHFWCRNSKERETIRRFEISLEQRNKPVSVVLYFILTTSDYWFTL